MLCENLKRIRTEQRYNRKLLGKLANCTSSTIQNIEEGRSNNPKIKTIIGLAKVLGVTVEDLMK